MEQIFAWCNTPKTEDCVGGYKFAREQLAQDGIVVSERAVSDFFTWFGLKVALDQAEEDAKDATQWMQDFKPGDEEAARKFGEFVFLQMAVRSQNPEIFTAATMARDMRVGMEGKQKVDAIKLDQAERKLAQKSEELKLAEKKYQRDTCKLFLKWFADEQAKQIAMGSGTNAEKIEALGRAMFGDDWDDA